MPTPFLVDPKRTNIDARLVGVTDASIVTLGNSKYAPPGTVVIIVHELGGIYGYQTACIGCGKMWNLVTGEQGRSKNPKVPSFRWTVERGMMRDPSSVTLSPSISFGCCHWHGSLIDGRFYWEANDHAAHKS